MYTKEEIKLELEWLNPTDEEVTIVRNYADDYGYSILEAAELVLDR
jgi:hypothetical protein